VADVGGDIERIDELGGAFDDKATLLQEQLIDPLTLWIDGSEEFFRGPNADQFREQWNESKPTFQSFVDALRAAAEEARTQANNIGLATGAR
jgi:hypothetical protein